MSEEKFDKRVIERKIKAGKIDQKEYDEYLSSLEDSADFAEEMQTSFIRKVGADEEESSSSDSSSESSSSSDD